MNANESYELSLKCRTLEGQIAQEKVLNQQLQSALSAEQSAHRTLRAEMTKRSEEFGSLRKEHDELQKSYRSLTVDLEEALGQMSVPASRTRNSHGGSALRASTSYYSPPETVDRWVQVEDQDMIHERDLLLQTIEDMKEEAENLKRENAAIRDAGRMPMSRSRQNSVLHGHKPPRDSASQDYTSDDSDEESEASAAVISAPSAFRLKLALPQLPLQSAAFTQEDTFIAEDTPRYGGGNLTGRLRVDQPVNLSHAISAASQRQIGRASYAAPTPRGGTSGVHTQGSINFQTPRLANLAEKFQNRNLSNSANQPPSRSPRVDENPDGHTLERHPTLSPSLSASNRRHNDPVAPPSHESTTQLEFNNDTSENHASPSPPSATSPSIAPAPPEPEPEEQTCAVFASLAQPDVPEADEVHMFSLSDTVDPSRCRICELMDQLKVGFGERMGTRQAYYAAGWLPEICERWMYEHQLVWTIEERASIATALHERYTRATFKKSHLAANARIWRTPSMFWKSPWKECHIMLHGVFLYMFNSDKLTEKLFSVSLVRGATITTQRNQDKDYVIKLVCLGCGTCVGAPGNLVEEVLIAFHSESTMLMWKNMLENLALTCPHMCSSKFANAVNPLREIAEDLLVSALREERRQKKLKSASP